MKTAHTRHAMSLGRLVAPLTKTGLAMVFALAAVACGNAAVENTGGAGGGSGKGGVAGSNSGGGGTVGGHINLSTAAAASGGSTSSSGACKGNNTAGCKAQYPEACGDGINNQNGIEECDDGNVLPGDGCNGACKVEPNWDCPPAGACTRKIICGDGTIGAGEVCDDGNTLDNDGCNSTCTVQDPAYHCDAGQRSVRGLRRRQHPGWRWLQQQLPTRRRLGVSDAGLPLQAGPAMW